jgi:RimJ/RimL family protein N-acetyltransferase
VDTPTLRAMGVEDVELVLDVQVPGAVRGLAKVFDQSTYPFPRDEVARRWREEIGDPSTNCFVATCAGKIQGFAATQGPELLHFGTAVETWGGGLATWLHDAVCASMVASGVHRANLRVFTDNARGRRFYEKLGWAPTGESTRSGFPPYPELLSYERDLSPSSIA